jgi:hypothetical protein
MTGARADRRELLKLLKAIGPGNVVTVTRIDRLARSIFDLFTIVKQIVDAKGQFRSLVEPWAGTAALSAPARRKAAAGRKRAGSIWAVPETHAAAAEGSTAAAGAGRNAQGTGEELQRRQIDDFAAGGNDSPSPGPRGTPHGNSYLNSIRRRHPTISRLG